MGGKMEMGKKGDQGGGQDDRCGLPEPHVSRPGTPAILGTNGYPRSASCPKGSLRFHFLPLPSFSSLTVRLPNFPRIPLELYSAGNTLIFHLKNDFPISSVGIIAGSETGGSQLSGCTWAGGSQILAPHCHHWCILTSPCRAKSVKRHVLPFHFIFTILYSSKTCELPLQPTTCSYPAVPWETVSWEHKGSPPGQNVISLIFIFPYFNDLSPLILIDYNYDFEL